MKSKYAMMAILVSACGLLPEEKPKQPCKFEKIRMKGLSAEGNCWKKKEKECR